MFNDIMRHHSNITGSSFILGFVSVTLWVMNSFKKERRNYLQKLQELRKVPVKPRLCLVEETWTRGENDSRHKRHFFLNVKKRFFYLNVIFTFMFLFFKNKPIFKIYKYILFFIFKKIKKYLIFKIFLKKLFILLFLLIIIFYFFY